MPYEVQMYTSHRTWKNAIATERGDDIQAGSFATREEATAALDELLADIAADMAHGFCPPWRLEDFRIQWVADQNCVSVSEAREENRHAST